MNQCNSAASVRLDLFFLGAVLAACVIAGCDTAGSATPNSAEPLTSGERGASEKWTAKSSRCPFAESQTSTARCDPARPSASGAHRGSSSKSGVLLVSHGSRSESWRKTVLDIEKAVRSDVLKSGRIAEVRSAFMEYSEPSIATQLKEFDREGMTDVILVPLLLAVSSHSFDDIPTIIGQKRDPLAVKTLPLQGIELYTPNARVCIAPLLDFPALLGKNVTRRVRQMSKDPAHEGVVLVAYGDEQYGEEWQHLLDEVGDEVKSQTGVDCVRHSWCGHVVRYESEPTATAIREVLKKKHRAIVVPVLVGVDEAFQGKIIGGAIKNVNANERIVYRHDAILPDENINRWVVDISLELASKRMNQNATSQTK
ncbi:MAG: sirohydrochlorin chelatase [Pirellulales bacterium]